MGRVVTCVSCDKTFVDENVTGRPRAKCDDCAPPERRAANAEANRQRRLVAIALEGADDMLEEVSAMVRHAVTVEPSKEVLVDRLRRHGQAETPSGRHRSMIAVAAAALALARAMRPPPEPEPDADPGPSNRMALAEAFPAAEGPAD